MMGVSLLGLEELLTEQHQLGYIRHWQLGFVGPMALVTDAKIHPEQTFVPGSSVLGLRHLVRPVRLGSGVLV